MCFVTYSWEDSSSEKKVDCFNETGHLKWAYIEPTSRCNFRCQWCYANTTADSSSSVTMSEEKLSGILHTLVDAGITQVTFGGGEPLLYPNLHLYVKELAYQGVVVNINTNGFYLRQEMTRRLADAGLNQVQMNIESIEPAWHDTVRGISGAHRRTIEAANFALKNNLTVVAQVVITRNNQDQAFCLLDHARNLGIPRFRVWDMTPSGKAYTQNDLLPTAYPTLLNDLTDYAIRQGAIQLQSYEPLFSGGLHASIRTVVVPCPNRLGMLINISAQGEIYYCCTLRTPLYQIDVARGADRLIEKHRNAIEQVNNQNQPANECTCCDRYSVCMGGCLTRSQWSGGRDYQCAICSPDYRDSSENFFN